MSEAKKSLSGAEGDDAPVSIGASRRWNRFLSLVMHHLRQQRPVDTSGAYGWFIERTQYWGKPYELPLAWFVTNGCSWDRAGSCTMCNFGAGNEVTREDLLRQVDRILERVTGLPMIYITPLGSMFDDKEVPPDVRQIIFHRIAQSGCKIYGTESRPETVTDVKMAQFRDAFRPDVVLQIGLGLETADSYIRRNCINKGLLEKDYLNAISVMKKHDIQAMTHVLLKPAFLSEAEAIEDALHTIEWAFAHGADRIVLFMTNLKPYTLTSWLQRRGRFRVPYVWSGLSVLQHMRQEHRRRFTLSGIYSGVTIHQTAYNCSRCTEYMLAGLQQFSSTHDSAILDRLSQYSCSCREEWRASLQRTTVDLSQRLAHEYEFIARHLFRDQWWLESRDRVLQELERSITQWDSHSAQHE